MHHLFQCRFLAAVEEVVEEVLQYFIQIAKLIALD